MGNFQHLADKVLSKSQYQSKSFQFPSLDEETGNFQPAKGNSAGNLIDINTIETHIAQGVLRETRQKTIRKPPSKMQETFDHNRVGKSFQPRDSHEILEKFFEMAPRLNIELLHGDRTWLQNILFGVRIPQTTDLLRQYIREWRAGVESEPVEYKQQNIGRYRANCFIRESIATRQYTYHGEKNGR